MTRNGSNLPGFAGGIDSRLPFFDECREKLEKIHVDRQIQVQRLVKIWLCLTRNEVG